MKIETFIICWDREDTIHLTLSYYLKLGKVFLYDNFSTDKTREIAESMGADVRLFGTAGVLDDGVYLDIKNHVWKRSNADFVIVVDDDEILYHPDLMMKLEQAKAEGYTVIKPKGFSIYSNEMPKESWLEVMTGFVDEKYSKLCCFNPKKITDIRYVYGCHEANPKGEVYLKNDLALLHYHGVGGVERMISRHKLYSERLSPLNKRWDLGKEYTDSGESKREWFKNQLIRCSKFPHQT